MEKAEMAAKKENRSLTNYITQLIRDDYLKKHQED